MRGKVLRLSPARRLIGDLMWFSMAVPRVTVQRRMRLAPLVGLREAAAPKPSWLALFVKGYGLLAQETPEFRRAYAKLPWPHLYQYPKSVASIAHEREHHGERIVLATRMKEPEILPIAEIDRRIRDARTLPIWDIKHYRLALRMAAAPLPLRRALMWLALNVGRLQPNYFGTFSVSVYSSLGAESFNPLSPLATHLNYGPIDGDGTVDVRILYDHRVMDGATVARALARFEAILNGPVAAELETMSTLSSPPLASEEAQRKWRDRQAAVSRTAI